MTTIDINWNNSGDHTLYVKKEKKERFADPELHAEAVYNRENGLPAPVNKSRSAEEAKAAAINSRNRSKSTSDLKLAPKQKNNKAERKARCRGVSGSYSRKDGNRFEYGLDDYDIDVDDADQSDIENEVVHDIEDDFTSEEYDEYVFSYDVEAVRSHLKDYFANGNLDSAVNELNSLLNDRESKVKLIKELVRCSIDYDQSRVTLGYKLFKHLSIEAYVEERHVLEAFESLLEDLNGILTDCPNARGHLAVFIAKAVYDGCIPYKPIGAIENRLSGVRQAVSCIMEVYSYLHNPVILAGKFENKGSHVPLEALKDHMERILREFLLSGDFDEVGRRLKELHAPHFNHEFVYLAGSKALEKMNEKTMDKLASLLKILLESGHLLESCVKSGFEKLFKGLEDLVLDVPAAYTLNEIWVKKCAAHDVINTTISATAPRASARRARTLSEGADGKFKVDEE